MHKVSVKSREATKHKNIEINVRLRLAKAQKSRSPTPIPPTPKRELQKKNTSNFFTGTPRFITENSKAFAKDINDNAKVYKNHRKWSKISLRICALIFLISFTAYKSLKKIIILPSINTLYNFMDTYESYDVETITVFDKISQTLKDYRKVNEINDNDEIVGILSVDAVSLTPHIKIDGNGKIFGLTEEIAINQSELPKLKMLIGEQETLIKKLKSSTINSAYVYYYQPLSPIYRCFTVFIQPSSSGKACKKQVDLLYKLKEILQKEKFLVISFAADGDTGYSKLVSKTNSYWKTNQRPVLDLSNTLFASDPLHLMKRGRYRLLSHELFMMEHTDTLIKTSIIQEILNLPFSVFNNCKITKMQDSLPLKLFTITNFLTLEYAGLYTECAYFLPFVLLRAALDSKKTDLNERINLLEIAINYLELYKEIYKATPQKKVGKLKGKKDCILFNNGILNDMMCSLITINSILNNIKGTVSLNRVGSNPLEHHFGLLRIRCKFDHRYSNFIKQEAKVNAFHEIEKEIVDNVVIYRRNVFGETLFIDEQYKDCQRYSNREVAYSILATFGAKTSKIKFHKESCPCFVENAYSQFINLIKSIDGKEESKDKTFILNSKELFPQGSSGAYIRQRQENSNINKS